jgi:hypothetical protein
MSVIFEMAWLCTQTSESSLEHKFVSLGGAHCVAVWRRVETQTTKFHSGDVGLTSGN